MGALSLALASGVSPGVREVAKAHATRKLEGRRRWRGLEISIENAVGSTRRGTDADGHAWATTMKHDYGYVRGTEGVDGDHIDVFLSGPEAEDRGDDVYIVHTVGPGTDRYDEDKVFLGFESEGEAVAAFNAHYDHPERHFGAVTRMSAKDFVAWCGDKERRRRSLCPRVHSKVNLGRRALRRAEKALHDHIEWMRAVARYGNSEPLDAQAREALDEDVQVQLRQTEKAVSMAEQAMSQAQLEIVDDPSNAGRRLLRVAPHIESIDLAHELTPLDVLTAAWPYYEACGNFDLEHATKSNAENLDEMVAELRGRGLAPKVNNGKISYEIGRPVKGSFNPEDGSYLVEIYAGDSASAEAATWFWASLTKTSPPVPWKTSIAGQAAYVDVLGHNQDPRLGVEVKHMKFERMVYFRWSNTAATLEAVNHWSPPVQIVRDPRMYRSTEKGLPAMTKTDSYTVKDVIVNAALAAAEAAVNDLMLSDQISGMNRYELLSSVEKALGGLEDAVLTREVSKALDYGVVSTDASALAGGAVAVREDLGPLTEFQKAAITDDLVRYTEKGLTPFVQGYQFSDDPSSDVADFVHSEMGVADLDDALDIAEGFFVAIVGRG